MAAPDWIGAATDDQLVPVQRGKRCGPRTGGGGTDREATRRAHAHDLPKSGGSAGARAIRTGDHRPGRAVPTFDQCLSGGAGEVGADGETQRARRTRDPAETRVRTAGGNRQRDDRPARAVPALDEHLGRRSVGAADRETVRARRAVDAYELSVDLVVAGRHRSFGDRPRRAVEAPDERTVRSIADHVASDDEALVAVTHFAARSVPSAGAGGLGLATTDHAGAAAAGSASSTTPPNITDSATTSFVSFVMAPQSPERERATGLLPFVLGCTLLDERGDRLAHVVRNRGKCAAARLRTRALRQPAGAPTPRPPASRPAPRAAAGRRSSPRARSTSASRSASSTSRSQSPMRYDSSASIRAAVQINSLALLAPTTRGSRCVPPRSGRIPYLCSSRPTLVPRANTRMSHASASCNPAPSA